MKKSTWLFTMVVMVMLTLTACGGTEPAATQTDPPASASPSASASPNSSAAPAAETATRTITYLGQSYTVPAKAERIVITGSMEAFEDALVLDVHPVGAITFGGKFLERFQSITDKAESIGEKQQPNFETILKLKPDVILGTSKFPAETAEKLKKIATMIPVSHIADNWEANLLMLGELTGKQAKAKEEIANYKKNLETSKAQLSSTLQDKNVLAVRIRSGKIFIYPQTIFVNPILYKDLGLKVPAEVQAAKAQEEISIEQFASMNPDHLFLQFATDENVDNKNALDELLANPIVNKMNAIKNKTYYVNVLDPLAEGGPAWSRIQFLKAAAEKLAK